MWTWADISRSRETAEVTIDFRDFFCFPTALSDDPETDDREEKVEDDSTGGGLGVKTSGSVSETVALGSSVTKLGKGSFDMDMT